MGELFSLYSLIQELMKNHVIIDETVKDVCLKEDKVHDLEPIEMASCAIIDACNEIEKSLQAKRCQCCCLT